MALTISGDGTSQAIYLQQNVGVIEYSVGSLTTPGSYTPISTGQWPVTISNSVPGASTILRVVVTNNLTFTSSYGNTNGYFIVGSTHITFDGSGNTITLNAITGYLGLIRNGTASLDGNANIVVQNFTTDIIGGTTLSNQQGWLCQRYFGRGVSGNSITNCTNNGIINGSQDAGGIAGAYVGYGGSVTITNCMNTGNASGQSSGGIVGGFAGSTNGLIIIRNCSSTGAIDGYYAGGIAGGSFAYNTNQNCIISGCYSTGVIGPLYYPGGIVGYNAGNNDTAGYTPVIDISNCYSLGNITDIVSSGGGICGGAAGTYTRRPTIRVRNCYSFGVINGNAGIVSASLAAVANVTTSNTYAANGSWSDTTANANLTSFPTGTGIVNGQSTTWTRITAGIPYLLSTFFSLADNTIPQKIYTPNSVSASTTYSSVPAYYQPGIYSIASTSMASSTLTTNVYAIGGTTPKYSGYGYTRYTITNTSGSTNSITATINASTGVLGFTLPAADPPYPCFLEGTKILCFENNEEVYRPVESLRKGDLVKTIYNVYMPICMMGTTALYNPGNDYRVANRIYKCPKEKYPTLFEDLYITGCHSILVPSMTDDQWENTKAVNGNIYVTDNHFRLIACADEKAEPYNKEGFMNIYHIALDHHDICMNYGIYANGLLVESCSIEYLIKYSNLKILGEADSAIPEDSGKISNNMTRQIVDTY
jgi:hypothetical protein